MRSTFEVQRNKQHTETRKKKKKKQIRLSVCYLFKKLVVTDKNKSTTSIWDLGEVLLVEILSRLPVKSIIRCRCVCKLWRNLVTDPYFIRLHLYQSKLKDPNLFLNPYSQVSFQTLDSDILEEFVPLPIDLPPIGGIKVVGSCNGLVCLSDRKTYLSLLNPSTREHVQLPFPPPYETSRISSYMGFGFDSNIKEYKVVRIEIPRDFKSLLNSEVMVYTLRTNSWRKVESALPSSSYCRNLAASFATYLDGILLWPGEQGSGNQRSVSIISFDLTTEMFGEVSLPDFDEGFRYHFSLGVLEGCVAMFHQFFGQRLDVWVMKDYGVKESWTKLFSIGRPAFLCDFYKVEPIVIRKNGDILLEMDADSLFVYDPVNKTARKLMIRGAPHRFKASTYVEALTSIASIMAGIEWRATEKAETRRRQRLENKK